MAESRDYYEILGVPRDADAETIKSAYRRLALQHHPDRSDAPDAAERFREATEAYAVLSDPEKRAMFDRHGRVPSPGEEPAGAGGFGRVDVGDLGDLFEELFGRRDPFAGTSASPFGGSPFGAGRGGPGGPSGPPRRGADLRAEVRIPFREAVLGGATTVRVDGETIDVRIPAGITEGRTLRIRGRGSPGPRGGPRGDLLVRVRVDPHPWYRREGLDVVLPVPVTIAEAALGATVPVPLPDGREADVRIPPGTSGGRRIRLRGQGIRAAEGTGDFLCEVQVVAPAPDELDDADREALARLAGRLTNPRSGGAWADMDDRSRTDPLHQEPPAC